MIANYGYSDGSGDFFIVVYGDNCDGCGKCVEVCPERVLNIITDDYDQEVVEVKSEAVKKISYMCSACRSTCGQGVYPCDVVCPREAIVHSW